MSFELCPIDMTIIERHDIQKGDLCEIQVLTLGPNSRLTHTRFGKLGYEEGDKILFHDGTSYFPIKAENIRSIQKVDEAYVARQYRESQSVTVHKYGSTYRGVVSKVGRTRLTVFFYTLGGKAKSVTVPAWEVRA